MNDRQLRAFVAVADLGSMNRAASRLYITQPALKRLMDGLEAELGVRLFDRGASGSSLTKAGRVFAEGAASLLDSMESLAERARASARRGTLSVCCLPDIAVVEVDEALLRLHDRFPDIMVRRVPLPTERWIECLGSGEADACVCYAEDGGEAFSRQGLEFRQIPSARECTLACIVSPRCPLAEKERVTAEDLRGYETVAGPLLYLRGGWGSHARKNGIRAIPDERAGRLDVLELCERGFVYMHPLAVAPSLKPLVAVPYEGFSTPFGLLSRRDRSFEVDCLYESMAGAIAG